MSFFYSTDIELADIQQTESFLQEKIDYYKMNFPGSPEISDMETALRVLLDLESDLTRDDDDDDEDEEENEEEGGNGTTYCYIIDWNDDTSTWGLVCSRNKDEAIELVRKAYADDKKLIDGICIDVDEDFNCSSTMEIGSVEEFGWG